MRCTITRTHFSMCGPQISNISITWDVLEMQILRPHPRSSESGSMEVGPSNLYFHSSSRLLGCSLKFENHHWKAIEHQHHKRDKVLWVKGKHHISSVRRISRSDSMSMKLWKLAQTFKCRECRRNRTFWVSETWAKQQNEESRRQSEESRLMSTEGDGDEDQKKGWGLKCHAEECVV